MSHVTVLLLFDDKTNDSFSRLALEASGRIGKRWRTATYLTKTRVVHYPFHLCLSSRIAPKHAAGITRIMRRLAAKTRPFDVGFDGFGMFKADLNVLWARTHPPATRRLQRLHDEVTRAINTVTPHTHTYNSFTPHVSIFADRGDIAKTLFRNWSRQGFRKVARATHLGVLVRTDSNYRITRFAL